ncbi:Pheromone B alpha 3 receptor [Psilocybe cubensis]|nr:Pheromone B alpha 3 receptor [Psilocybe cubensis]KAH9485289.1 Pheromone B alpha 3 receptor [Psilocybe cubensis]
MVDLAIGLGIPVIVMVLHYIVQGHRFNIFEEVGCYPFTYNTPPAYFLVYMVPIPIGLTSGAYCIMSIIAFRKRQTEFKEILSSNSNLNSNRFFRLMALAGIEVICCIPLSITTMVLNATRGVVNPWISWEDTHWGFSRVDQIPAVLWRSTADSNVSVEMSRWLLIVCGLVFFAFFGFADEAQRHYKLAMNSVAKRVGYTTFTGSTKIGTRNTSSSSFKESSNMSSSQGAGLPVFIRQETVEKRDSVDTSSDLTSMKDSVFASEKDFITQSTHSALTKNDAPLKLASFIVTPPNPHHGLMVMDGPAPSKHIDSFPSSVTPSGSFLDLSATQTEIPASGNDNKV